MTSVACLVVAEAKDLRKICSILVLALQISFKNDEIIIPRLTSRPGHLEVGDSCSERRPIIDPALLHARACLFAVCLPAELVDSALSRCSAPRFHVSFRAPDPPRPHALIVAPLFSLNRSLPSGLRRPTAAV